MCTRWKKLLNNCDLHGILPLRVAAIDAKKGQKSHTYEGENNFSTSEDIPPEVVATTWDSSFNAQFDKKCFVNAAVPMTPSERACAASHVMIWKLIYQIFATNMNPNSELAIFLSSSEGTKKSTSGSRKQVFKPLPNRRVYDIIPKIWLSAPRPQYQSTLLSEKQRQAEVSSICNLFSIRNQRTGSVEYHGQYFLILEDDATIDPHPKIKGPDKYANQTAKKLTKKDFLQRLKEIEEKIPADFDICYLGCNGKVFQGRVKKVLVRPLYVWQLHAYLLSAKGAAKLLMHLPVSGPVDNFIAKLIFEKSLEVSRIQ
jgi:GR25 family glycosyltransferase involved in LPS biosynthesis